MWDKRLTQLRDALSTMILFPNNVVPYLQTANIRTSTINFDGGPLAMWNNVLLYADNNNQVGALVDAVLEQYPNNPYLLTFKEKELIDYNPGPDIRHLEWKARMDNSTREKIIQNVSTLLPIRFLSIGLDRSRAVARVKVIKDRTVELGSGFLVEGDIFVTNNHVISNEEEADRAVIEFNYQEVGDGVVEQSVAYHLSPKEFFRTNEKEDWTLVKVDGKVNELYGHLNLKPGGIDKGDYVNIVQHPGGRYKQLALYHNVVTYSDTSIIQYLTDTEPGSSGAPVFNSDWDVVALHHSGGMLEEPGVSGTMLRNEGIAVEKIIEGLQKVGVPVA